MRHSIFLMNPTKKDGKAINPTILLDYVRTIKSRILANIGF